MSAIERNVNPNRSKARRAPWARKGRMMIMPNSKVMTPTGRFTEKMVRQLNASVR